jgi:hypothetical protein
MSHNWPEKMVKELAELAAIRYKTATVIEEKSHIEAFEEIVATLLEEFTKAMIS